MDFLRKTFIQWNVWKKLLLLLASKLIEKIPDPCNTKEHYQSFIREKNTKSVKQAKVITYQPKTFKNPNIIDMKSVITKHPKTLHKLLKIIRQTEKAGSLHSDTKKWKFFKRKKM